MDKAEKQGNYSGRSFISFVDISIMHYSVFSKKLFGAKTFKNHTSTNIFFLKFKFSCCGYTKDKIVYLYDFIKNKKKCLY